MSSLRNAVKRVTHKERSQPTNRAHLGILEKKKDYKIRAKQYHNKQDELKSLWKKANERNPDEFYFGMNKSGVKGGRHEKLASVKQKEVEDQMGGADGYKLMKTQDLSYVRMQTMKDKKKVERLQSSLHFLGDNAQVERKHIIFVDDEEQKKNFSMAEHFDCPPELAERSFNRPRISKLIEIQQENSNIGDGEGEEIISKKKLDKERKKKKKIMKQIARARTVAYRELNARTERIEQLKETENHLIAQKLQASKGRKRKITPAEEGKPAIYKFSRKRLG